MTGDAAEISRSDRVRSFEPPPAGFDPGTASADALSRYGLPRRPDPEREPAFATDLDEDILIRYLDRFLMCYVRTADRLQRTDVWFNNLEGGIDYLRQVLLDDSLGICADLEAEMARIVASYRCEWKATVEDPAKLVRFRTFVNSPAQDPSLVHIPLRAQHRPATWEEKAQLVQSEVG